MSGVDDVTLTRLGWCIICCVLSGVCSTSCAFCSCCCAKLRKVAMLARLSACPMLMLGLEAFDTCALLTSDLSSHALKMSSAADPCTTRSR